MSLATRCPNCNTVFQVNEEQLKRFSGVVRCGVCQSAFNGIDHLIGRLSPSDSGSASSNTQSSVSPALASNEITSKNPAQQENPSIKKITSSNFESFSTEISEDNENSKPNEAIKMQEAALKASFEKQIQSISFDLSLPASDEDTPAFSADAPKSAESTALFADSERKEPFLTPVSVNDDSAHPTTPDVLKNEKDKATSAENLAEIVKKKKKRSRFSQFFWSIGTLVLLLLLGIQGIYRYSEQIIAWWPPAEELVLSTCELLSCPAGTPVMNPPLSVEAGTPEKLENVPDQYTQQITITNNSQDLQVWPPLVLELAAEDNQVLLRRIIKPEEYLPEEAGTAKGLQPASGITFKMTFEFSHNSAINSRVSLLTNP